MSMANTANQAPYYQSPGSALACSTTIMKGLTKGYDLVTFWDFRGSCNRHDLKHHLNQPLKKKNIILTCPVTAKMSNVQAGGKTMKAESCLADTKISEKRLKKPDQLRERKKKEVK